jgi:hypothetical protein
VSDYDIHKEINRMVGMSTTEEFMQELSNTISNHPGAHIVAIIYDEEEGHFEVAGTEIPIPYAIGMINGALDSMMATWFPGGEEEED